MRKRMNSNVARPVTNPDGLMRMNEKSIMSLKTHTIDHRHDKNATKRPMLQHQLGLVIRLYSHKARATTLMVQVRMKRQRKSRDLTTGTNRVMPQLQLDLATLLFSLATRPCIHVRQVTILMDLGNMMLQRRRLDRVTPHHLLAPATRP